MTQLDVTMRVGADKLPLCRGCRDDFYNGQNPLNITRCWSLKDARIVTRYRIGWWTPADSAKNFTEVTTLSCHHAPGQYALMEKLPEHLR